MSRFVMMSATFSLEDIFDRKTVVLLDLVSDPMVLDVHVARMLKVHDGPVCDMDRGLVVAEYVLLVWHRMLQLL